MSDIVSDGKFVAGGHTITFAVSVGSLKRLRDQTGIDFVSVQNEDISKEAFARFFASPEVLTECVKVLAKDSFDAAGLTEGEFDDLLDASVIGQARAAMVVAVANFFQGIGDRVRYAAMDEALSLVEAAMSAGERDVRKEAEATRNRMARGS